LINNDTIIQELSPYQIVVKAINYEKYLRKVYDGRMQVREAVCDLFTVERSLLNADIIMGKPLYAAVSQSLTLFKLNHLI